MDDLRVARGAEVLFFRRHVRLFRAVDHAGHADVDLHALHERGVGAGAQIELFRRAVQEQRALDPRVAQPDEGLAAGAINFGHQRLDQFRIGVRGLDKNVVAAANVR